MLHITFSRLALRPVENYDHLDDKWLEGKPQMLAPMERNPPQVQGGSIGDRSNMPPYLLELHNRLAVATQ